jgi:dihydropteroate synthase/2-amino-4-hydroxy-6-hydroxymethyldihydropteridine diphosphokinase
MKKALIYIGAGTNLGNRAENLRLAAQLLPPAVKILRTSSVYETEPWGFKDQNSFYNLVWEAETTLPPASLLSYLKKIEKRIGRIPNFRYGPRVIDLDILLYDDESIQTDELIIPHPQIPNRQFVLVPLCDLIPEKLHPEFGKTWHQLLSELPSAEITAITEKIDFSRIVFRWGIRTYLMGILNLTPDSFSKDGIYGTSDEMIRKALQKSEALIAAGMDIIDIGAESSRPGFTTITVQMEQERLLPVLKAIRTHFPSLVLAVDTRNASTAEAAIQIGADWINDIGGAAYDDKMSPVCASSHCPIVLMRNKPLQPTGDTINSVRSELLSLVDNARKAGICDEQIIIDPGIGFGTTPEQNLEIINNLQRIREMGFPVLIGPSRKSFIGHYLQKEIEARLEGTAAAIAAGIMNGADIIRIHDAAALYDVAKMVDSIIR